MPWFDVKRTQLAGQLLSFKKAVNPDAAPGTTTNVEALQADIDRRVGGGEEVVASAAEALRSTALCDAEAGRDSNTKALDAIIASDSLLAILHGYVGDLKRYIAHCEGISPPKLQWLLPIGQSD